MSVAANTDGFTRMSEQAGRVVQPNDYPPERLIAALPSNAGLAECLRRLETVDLPNWYLGAGCITQTIWNAAHELPAEFGIDDYDIVYFDADVSAEAEERAAACVRDALAGLPVRPDVKNQARVHVWYASRFGYSIRPYASCEDAIATWPTTATAIGVRCTGDTVTVEAPFGLHDLFDLVVRPNRVQVTPAIFAAKVERWITRWPSLKIEPWENGVGTPGMRWSVE